MNLANNLKLVIFDMDGLMLDTEIVHFQTWMDYSKEYGFKYDIKKRLKYTGMTDESVIEELSNELGSRDKALEMRGKILHARKEYFMHNSESLIKNGLLELLKYLDEKSIQKVVASSSGRGRLEFLLRKEGLLGRFDHIITKEDVSEGKPNPEIFLKAYEKYDFDKKECLILEDSQNGYLAAKNSGLPYMIVPDSSFCFHNLTVDNTYKDLYEVKEFIENNFI